MEKKIDIHLHLSEHPIPDGLGMKISSGAEMLPHLDELGIGFGIIMSSGEKQAMFGSNASCRRIAEQYPDRYAWMCGLDEICLLYTSPSPRDYAASRMPSSA